MELTASIMFSGDMRAVSHGRKMLDIIDSVYPNIFPKRYGLDEPLRRVLERDAVEECLRSVWAQGFLWRGRRGEAIWSIPGGKRVGHHKLILYGALDVDLSLLLMEQLTREWPVDVACIHFPARPELEATRSAHREMFAPFNSGLATIELRRYLPNLAWGMYLGRRYVDLIGRERLLTTPAVVVAPWSDGVYVQLTEKVEDVLDYKRFDAIRRRAKEHIGMEYFFDPTGAISNYRAPAFELPDPTPPG